VRIVLSSICLETGTDIQLALYYLKSSLERIRLPHQSSPTVIIKTFSEDLGAFRIARDILKNKPLVAAFSCYVWNIEKTILVCRALKIKDPGIWIVLGGPEVTPRPDDILVAEKSVDIIVRGEGEKAFCDCVERILRGLYDMSGIPDISFRRCGRVVHNTCGKTEFTLARIPSPYLSGAVNLADRNILDVPLESSRGCSSRCQYCYYHKNFSRVRLFPLARVEKELETILSFRKREVYLLDATFNAYPQRAKKILRLFIRHNRCSNLHVELKAELIDEEMAGLLRKARAFNIEIGIQSTNTRTLKAINRGFDRKKFVHGINLLNKYGLLYEIQLIDALPYQSYSDLKESLDWLYSLHPVKVAIFPLSLLPGTALRENASRYGMAYTGKPPYHAYKSNAMSCADIRRVERLRFAMERLYDSQVFQKTLYELRDKAGIRISDVFEYWIDWTSRLSGASRISPDGYNKRLPIFLQYVCRKRRISGMHGLVV